jgi:PPOX class probable F420-dependent enzyme
MSVAKLTDTQIEFLEQPYPAVVTTIRRDGSPHNTVVWIDVEDGVPTFNTAYGRAKPTHLERDPHVGLIVVDPSDQYRWLAVDGQAELTTDGADDQIDRLAKKYTGADSYQNRRDGEQRVKVRITPRRVESRGLG